MVAASVNPEAFELYLQGRQAWNLRTMPASGRAEDLLNRALKLEPDFARAHAALADVWSLRGQGDDTLTVWQNRESPLAARVIAKCREALRLDPRSAEAHASLGGVCWSVWRFAEAEPALREAIGLNPNYASAHQWLGRVLFMRGELDEALVELKRATELDPLSHRILDNYAWGLIFADRLAEALQFADRALELPPTSQQALGLKALALAELGRGEPAAGVARSVAADSFGSVFRRIALGLAGKVAETGAPIAAMKEGDLISRVAGLAALKRYDDVLNALDPAWRPSSQVDLLLFLPVFDPLRADPRFKRALETLGLTEGHARAQVWRAAHPPEKAK